MCTLLIKDVCQKSVETTETERSTEGPVREGEIRELSVFPKFNRKLSLVLVIDISKSTDTVNGPRLRRTYTSSF